MNRMLLSVLWYLLSVLVVVWLIYLVMSLVWFVLIRCFLCNIFRVLNILLIMWVILVFLMLGGFVKIMCWFMVEIGSFCFLCFCLILSCVERCLIFCLMGVRLIIVLSFVSVLVRFVLLLLV